MKKPDGYDDAQAFDGNFPQLELGGHVCIIKDAQVGETSNYNPCLRLYLDIAEGTQKDFFAKKFQNDKQRREDAKWGCIFTQLTEGNSLPYFKGMISAVNKSNPGYDFEATFDEKTLKGKYIGGIFGREQYRKNDGTTGWATKCRQIRSVDAIREGVPAPEDKLLDGGSLNPYGEMRPLDEIPF